MNAPQSRGRRVAVIDIGTNTLLLLVAEVEQRDNRLVLTAVRDTCEFGRLGQGLDKTGALAADAIERSLAIARRYRAVIDELKVDTVCAVGTQALREAGNASEFVAPAEKILGVPIEVIAGEREAELVFRAVSESFPELARFVIADVGGGSTEIIAAAGALTQVESFTSLPIGSVRLHERHLHADPPTPAQVQALVAGVDDALASVVATLPKGVCLVGTAGTATTIGSVELKLRSYDPDKIQGLRLPVEVVERQLARYLELTLGERRHMPGLPPERADVIAAGTAIYARLLHHLEASAFVISDRGVRWGLAYELAATGAQ